MRSNDIKNHKVDSVTIDEFRIEAFSLPLN